MNSTEAIEIQAHQAPNMIRNLLDLVEAISVGVLCIGLPGTKAVEYELGIYRAVAKYENLTDPPPRPDIETSHRVFWTTESMNKLEILIDKLIEEGKPFVAKTGDGSGENPFIILRWEREVKEQARH